ncbi:MAG: hypothetical protein AAF772_01175 [Acidobacteriota bacterium]
MARIRAARPRDDLADVVGDAYAPVSLRPSWGLLSIVCFLLILPSRRLAWMLVAPVWGGQVAAYAAPLLTPGLALLGLGFAWLGQRAGRSRGMPSTSARIGLFLNGIAFGLVLLMILAFILIRFVR